MGNSKSAATKVPTSSVAPPVAGPDNTTARSSRSNSNAAKPALDPNRYSVIRHDSGEPATIAFVFPHLELLDTTDRPLRSWPIKFLRGFGQEQDVFSFEAGRRCPGGEGLYFFHVKEGRDIAADLSKRILDEKRAGNDIYAEISAPPVQVPSLPHKGSVVVDTPTYAHLSRSGSAASPSADSSLPTSSETSYARLQRSESVPTAAAASPSLVSPAYRPRMASLSGSATAVPNGYTAAFDAAAANRALSQSIDSYTLGFPLSTDPDADLSQHNYNLLPTPESQYNHLNRDPVVVITEHQYETPK